MVVGEDRRKDIHESIEEYRAINSLITHPEVRIYKRKEESKKNERKHVLDQENDQEKKEVFSWSL